MATDLHCHYFPAEAALEAGALGLVTAMGDGSYRFGAGERAMSLEPGLVDLETQRMDMRRQGVSRRALSIPPFTVQYELPAGDGARWSRNINDGLAEAVHSFPDEFAGFATVPLQDVAAGVEELRRAIGDLGLHGVEILTNINGVELDAPELDPFWEEAARSGAPVLVHPHNVAGASRMGEYYLRNLVGNPVETALAGARLLFGGVLERFPGLKIILSHGGGALPGLIGRLEHGHGVRPEARLRASAPMEQLRRLYYDTVVFDATVLRHVVEIAGASQVVPGTDYPFDMGETNPVAFIQSAGLSDADVRTILNNGDALLGAGRNG